MRTNPDITKRKQAEKELAESEARYRALAENSPLAIFVNRDDKVVLANAACAKLFGASSPEELIGKSALDLFDPDSRSLVRERISVDSEEVPLVEVRILRLDGTSVDVEATASPFLDHGVKAIQVLLRDITERKQVEQKLAESEARYRTLAERSPLAVLVCHNDKDDDTVILVNAACVKLFGASSPEELVGRSAMDLFHPDSQPRVHGPIHEATSETVPSVEAQIVRLDGTPVDVDITAAPLLDQGLSAVQVVLRDITELKKAHEQATRLAAIVTSSPDAIATKDLDEVITSWNPAAEAMYGYTAEEITGSGIDVLMAPGLEDEHKRLFKRVLKGEKVEQFETQRMRKDGNLVDVALTLFPILDDAGDTVAVSVMAHDITEAKRTEEMLRQSEEKFVTAFRASPDSLTITRLSDGEFLDVNKGYERMFGYTRAESVGKTTADLSVYADPDTRLRLVTLLREAGEVTDFESTLRRKDGTLFTGSCSAQVLEIQGEECFVSVVRDISERKKAEDAVRTSEAKLREAQRIGRIGSFDWDARTSTTVWSDETYRLYGRDPKEKPPTYEERLKMCTPESAARLDAATKRSAQTSEPYVLDVEEVRPDGTRVWVTSRGEATRDPDGTVIGLHGTVQDITERKEAERERLRAEKFFRDTFEKADVGIAHVNTTDGTWLRVNQRLCDMLGYSREELLATTFAALTHPDDVDENTAAFRRMLAGEESAYVADKRYLRKDGSIIWVHLNIVQIRKEDGTPDYNLDVLTDITERKQAEEALAASERFSSHLLDTTPTLVYIYDLVETRNVYANREITEFLGYTPEEILAFGSALFERLLHPDDAALVAEHHERLHKLPPGDDSILEVDYRMKRSDGEWRWLHSRDIPFARDDTGVVTQILGSTDDVTEQKTSAELALRQAKRIERTLTSVIDIAGNIVELRDPYTAGHERRVSELAVRIAESLGASGHEVDDIRVAGLLHDIGKAGIPTEILSKPGELSPIEFTLIKGHVEAGYRLSVSANMAEPIAEMIYEHHERADGSGYPRGLTGDQTLLGAKVLAVADVVEAMMSHRPYRSALGIKAALAEIERGAGTLYDAGVVEACVRLFNEDGFEFSA